MENGKRNAALAKLNHEFLDGKLGQVEYDKKRLELEAGSQKADLFPVGTAFLPIKEQNRILNLCDYIIYSSKHCDVLATAVKMFPDAIGKEIDHFKKVVDYQVKLGRGGFLTRLLEAFVHADLENSAAMLPLMHYLEQKYQLCEEGFKKRTE